MALLACAVVFNAVFVAPELRIDRVPLNDIVFHLAASERMETSFERGEPFLDPWVSEWSLGYPVWRSYQPLPHVVGALVLRLFRGAGEPAAIFAALFYLLIVTFPISVYAGARLLGLPPPAAGLGALLVFASSAAGFPGSYGLGYGSILWRGSGLYTQLFALHLMAIAVGVGARALDGGRKTTRILASVLLALTGLAHIIFGYAAFVSVALLAVVGPRSRRSERLVRLLTVVVPALLLLTWFFVPLALSRGVVNHSRWEDPRKWDSYGAPFILRELLSGRLLDFGRAPLLSLLVAVGALGAVLSRGDALARRLLALSGLWLALFFGRETWGRLMIFAGIPADFPMHRLQGVFELSAILLGAYGLVRLIQLAAERKRVFGVAGAIAVAIAILGIGAERARYLNQNQTWGEGSLAAYQRERPDLEAALADVRSILAARPGRVSAGLAATWGGQFKVGSVPVHAFLSLNHIDQASFLYHSMSKTSDVMVARDENNRVHDVVFGIRAVVAPASQPMPNHLLRRSVHGRLAVYESSPEGYFGAVDVVGHYTGPPSTDFEPSAAWLKSVLPTWGLVISLDPRSQVGPAIGRWEALPNPTPEQTTLRSRVLGETKTGENYRATIEASRPSYAFIKITWNPDLVATVDGRPAPVIHVTPGFGAVPIPAGRHEVSVAYRPGILKPFLFVFGVGAFALGWFALGRSRLAELEARASARIAVVGARFATPGAVVAAALILAGVVALHPLFRGRLIAGHDGEVYLPRLVEMVKVLGDGQIPPVWAPDLSAGHGQPLFEFSPPLPYWIALPFRALGFGLTDSLQLSLALLYFLGAAAVYRIGRRFQAPRFAALGGAVAWLFGPYLCLDLFVRAAFGEASAVALAPIALWALLEAMARPSAPRIAAGAGAMALMQLGHHSVALLLFPAFSIVVLVYGIAAFRSSNDNELRSRRFAPLAAGAAILAGAMGLTAYFWIPSLAELSNLNSTRLLAGQWDWSGHILWPFQLLWSPWGYGLSVPGPNDGMSFALGFSHLALGVAGFIIAWRYRRQPQRALAITFGVIALAGALLTTYWTSWIWSHVHLLQHTLFPWRALLIPGLLLPLLAVFVLERVGPRWTVVFLTALVVLNLPHTEPQGYLTYDEEYYYPQSLALRGINATTFEEFEPRWAEQRPAYYPSPLVGLAGPIEVTEISRRTARQEFAVKAESTTAIESATFFYPGWGVTIDGIPVSISPVPVRGTILFGMPGGEHRVVLELGQTPVRRAAAMTTLITFVLLGAAVAISYLRRRTLKNHEQRVDSAAANILP